MGNRRYPTDAEAKKLIVEIGRRMYAKNFVAVANIRIFFNPQVPVCYFFAKKR